MTRAGNSGVIRTYASSMLNACREQRQERTKQEVSAMGRDGQCCNIGTILVTFKWSKKAA
jgi:hypothetical protein